MNPRSDSQNADEAQKSLSKFARYRRSRRDKGMKLLRIWVPDPQAPGFAEEVTRQAALLKGSPEEMEILDWIESGIAEVWSE